LLAATLYQGNHDRNCKLKQSPVVSPFVLSHLAVVLSVLRFTASDYNFDILKLLFRPESTRKYLSQIYKRHKGKGDIKVVDLFCFTKTEIFFMFQSIMLRVSTIK
jgi:hypothetical protein